MSGRNRAIAARESPLSRALPSSTRRKPNRRRIGLAANFMVRAPRAAAKVSWPDAKALRPKPACSSSGSRNGRAPMPDPEQEAAR